METVHWCIGVFVAFCSNPISKMMTTPVWVQGADTTQNMTSSWIGLDLFNYLSESTVVVMPTEKGKNSGDIGRWYWKCHRGIEQKLVMEINRCHAESFP